jgi:uncharacterized membrane protein
MKDDLKALLENAEKTALQQNALWTPEMVKFLVIAILAFTVLALLMTSVLMYKKDKTGRLTLRLFGIIIIICMSSVLMVVGYSDSQLTPIIGLFGAIAGYLLGRDANPQSLPENKEGSPADARLSR